MPTLIRLIIVLLFLGGLVYGGMVLLITMVEPTPREVTVRIPTRDLLNEPSSAPTALPGANAGAATPAPEAETTP